MINRRDEGLGLSVLLYAGVMAAALALLITPVPTPPTVSAISVLSCRVAIISSAAAASLAISSLSGSFAVCPC